MRLEQITVQAFRGYPSRADIVLTADVVVLHGENGTGKTSLTEAFEWALFDSIVRKERSKTPGEYQGTSWIRSVHARADVETFAEVTLIEGRKRHVVRRTLVGNGTELTIDGAVAADVSVLGLRTEDAFRPFLGQCEIQALIDSEQQSRWEQLSAILGFAAFGQIRERLQRLRTDTDRDERVRRLRERVTRAVQPLTPSGSAPLDEPPDDMRARAAALLKLTQDVEWSLIRDVAQEELDALLIRDRRPPGLDVLVCGPTDLSPVATRLIAAIERLESHAAEHRRWHEVNLRSGFASQGLELIDPEHPEKCPFCAQPTLSDAQVSVLRDNASHTSGPEPADPRTDVRDAMGILLGAGPLNRDAIEVLLESIGESVETENLQAVKSEQAALDELRNRAQRLGEAALAVYETASRPHGDDMALKGMVSELTSAAEEIRQRHAALRAQLEAIDVELTKRFSGLDDPDKTRMAELQKAVLLAENGSAAEAAWRLRRYQQQLQVFVAELESAEKARMASALQILSEDIARYYDELSPGGRIKILGISVRDTKRRQAALAAMSHGKEINPVTMFSEAEGNCFGLSLYFSQRVDRNPGWSMIMLDDPVQSMDQGHEEGLIHLLTRVSRDHQVVIMTHATRFAGQVETQFARVGSFTKYTFERGAGPEPQISLAEGRLDELLNFAQANAEGELARRESCAGAVRKAVERFCSELGTRSGTSLRRGSSAEEMIDRLHHQKVIDGLDAGTLHRIRKFGNRGSHDDATVNPATSSILSNVSTLRDLQKTYLPKELEDPIR